jgi:hypothetical protein
MPDIENTMTEPDLKSDFQHTSGCQGL